MSILRDDRGLAQLLDNDAFELVASGFNFTEGPVWLPEGALLFSDIPANRIMRWTPADGVTVWREPSGNSNGLTLDTTGRLVACEHGNRRVSLTTADGSVTTLADRWQGQRLNSPNDLVVHSSGAVFFTDPPYGVKPDQRELEFQGVYRLDPDGSMALLANDFIKPNGIALSPDEAILYVNDTEGNVVRAFDLTPGLGVTNERVFCQFTGRGADGMKVDVEGRVYSTGPDGLHVFAADGAPLGTIVLPEKPANVAWGDADRQTLYLTARKGLYRVRTKVRGVAPA